MSQCWCEAPKDRPTFCHLRRSLEDLLTKDCQYLELINGVLQPCVPDAGRVNDKDLETNSAAQELFKMAAGSQETISPSSVTDRDFLLVGSSADGDTGSQSFEESSDGSTGVGPITSPSRKTLSSVILDIKDLDIQQPCFNKNNKKLWIELKEEVA